MQLLDGEVTRAKVYDPNSYVIQFLVLFNQDVITLYILVKDLDRVHVDGCVHQLSHNVLVGTQGGGGLGKRGRSHTGVLQNVLFTFSRASCRGHWSM